MRRALVAAAALLGSVALSACGPNASELEPGLKSAMRDLAKAIVVNDQASKDFVQNFVLVGAGQHGNPVGAKDADTPEGRERLHEANRRWLRKTFKDAGIDSEAQVEVFMQAIKYNIDGKNAWVRFEIAAEGRRVAETVNFRLSMNEKGWKVFAYSREMKGMR
jgi:hypothetical protein